MKPFELTAKLTPKLVNSFSRQTWVYRWHKFRGLQYKLADHVNRKSSWVARQIRWPLGVGSPHHWPEVHVLRIGGIGDCLMGTPALRVLKETRPDIRIVYYTPFPAAFRGLPFLDEVGSVEDYPHPSALWNRSDRLRKITVNHFEIHRGYGDRCVELVYEACTPLRRHLARIFGDQLGLEVQDVRPSCIFDEARIRAYQEAWAHLPRPWVLVNRHSGFYPSLNKDWPREHWDRLVARLLDKYTIIEIGTCERGQGEATRHPHYVDLTGTLPLDRFLASVAAADIHIGPISGPVHIAAAAGKPAVVIYGGREHPDCTHYPGNIDLYTSLPCSECWLPYDAHCPYDRICLSRISPEQVEEAVVGASGRLRPLATASQTP